tara:strand:- start:93 stop:662 length:570 start_codon:yes stop_codon:yes gene_type:complete
MSKKEFLESRNFKALTFVGWLKSPRAGILRRPDATRKKIMDTILYDMGGPPGVIAALTSVQSKEKWYKYDPSVSSASEAARKTAHHLIEGISPLARDKEYETTTASLYIAGRFVHSRLRLSEEQLGHLIHDAWCCTNAYVEKLDKLRKRDHQYRPYHELSVPEQKKDLAFLRGVLSAKKQRRKGARRKR